MVSTGRNGVDIGLTNRNPSPIRQYPFLLAPIPNVDISRRQLFFLFRVDVMTKIQSNNSLSKRALGRLQTDYARSYVWLWSVLFALMILSPCRRATGQSANLPLGPSLLANDHSSRRAQGQGANREGVRVAQQTLSYQDTSSPLDTPRDPKLLATNLRGFGVPFRLDANNDAFIEVQLYLSTDRGRSWSFYSRQTTDKEEFPFQADRDGEYWFALKTLNRDRKLLPSGDPQPELKIIVDSVKPTLDFRVQTDSAGRVICYWQAFDTYLKPESLKIFYQPIEADGTKKQWMRVPVELGGQVRNGVYSDQVGWWPETSESMVNVAIEIQDAAGNATRVDRKILIPQTAWRNRSVATARPNPSTNETRNTNRTTVEKRGTGVPQQPDWAQPNWTPPSLPPSQSDTFADDHQAETPNVVCENGVCRIVGDGDGMFQSPQVAHAPRKPSGTGRNPQPSNLIAKQPVRTASNSRTTLPLVGSQEEFVDPPTPPGYQFPAEQPASREIQVAQGPSNVYRQPTQPPSQIWESERQSWLPESQQATSSTTRRIDPSIMPQKKQIPTSPSTFVPSNPPTTRFEGDKVISQSSTMGRSNQYRGGKPTATELPKPELLPNHRADDNFPNTTQPAFQENTGTMRSLTGGGTTRANASDRKTPFNQAGFQNRNERPIAGPISDKPLRETNASVNFIGSKRFRLPYGIDTIDPSGVGRVDLWMTRDDGQTWNNYGTDPDSQSPFPVEIDENDGRYGFRIVVHSKEGLSGLGPASGDDADIWVNIDTMPPIVQIKSVPYGRGEEKGRLVINYSANDNFLSLRPISLFYSATPEGPWTLIESGLRNEQRYVWKVDPQAPKTLYLKIEAIDRAQNVGVHVLSQAIDTSGLVPSGTIHGVTPVGN